MIASGLVVEDVFRKLSKRCAHAQLVADNIYLGKGLPDSYKS